jgi:hypothetical protein
VAEPAGRLRLAEDVLDLADGRGIGGVPGSGGVAVGIGDVDAAGPGWASLQVAPA